MAEQNRVVTEKEIELQLKIQELQFQVWDLESMAAGLLQALNACQNMRQRKESGGKARI